MFLYTEKIDEVFTRNIVMVAYIVYTSPLLDTNVIISLSSISVSRAHEVPMHLPAYTVKSTGCRVLCAHDVRVPHYSGGEASTLPIYSPKSSSRVLKEPNIISRIAIFLSYASNDKTKAVTL